MPSSPERFGLKAYAGALWIHRQPRIFSENTMEAGPLATAHRSGNTDALYKGRGV